MKYTLNKTNYHDFAVYELNKLPARSYFIPYTDRTGADAVTLKEKRYQSGKVQCLNGAWDFKFYPLPKELPDTLDTDAVQWDTLDVPSCWQFRGYDKPFYVNIRYQFPFNPPVIPMEDKVGTVFSWSGVDQKISARWIQPEEQYNFVGVYRRFIDVADAGKRFTIGFMGAASCLDLYLNGEFIGYSEGAHNTAEFDLTGRLHAGQNELVAVVHRWCTGTYLESQDMFRSNGIFRDVLLRIDEPTDFADIDAVTKKTGDTYSLTMTASVYADTAVTFTLEGHGLKQTKTVQTEGKTASVTFDALNVTEWNAEAPTLYTMYYETATSCVKERIGFKTVEIKGDLFLFNGKKIKFRGVNHHDTSAANGYTLTPDEIEQDVRLCKAYNMDTIRTSHYPPDPLLLELADELGVYIVDENDLETHGTVSMQIESSYNTISHDPKWQPRYVDRITRLYQRDKLHGSTSIIMWSLGNEAGGYLNTDAMADYLHQHSSLPVHYESAIHCDRIAYDVGSEMYPSVQMVHDVGEHCRREAPLNDRPYFLCEYAHAMGVGPGNAEAYWQEIYTHDNLMGGCVWEMVDHAVLHEDGSYTYGGDHGEWEHDGNFCVDGLFYPDRTPSTGAKNIRFIYRPIRVKHLGGSSFEVFNTCSFSGGERYELVFSWNDGTEQRLRVPAAPMTKTQIEVQPGQPVNGTLSLIVTTIDTVTGEAVAQEQAVLDIHVPAAPAVTTLDAACKVENSKLTITCDGKPVLTSADESTILYRAATDNDIDGALMYFNTMTPYMAQTETFITSEALPAGCKAMSLLVNEKMAFELTDRFEGVEDGTLITSRIHCASGRGIIPRFGKSFRLDESFDLVEYTGRTGESYIDMCGQFPVGHVCCRVADMTEPNIKPQESGNRMDCTEAVISDGKTRVRFIAVDHPFELSIKPYTDRALAAMKHREDEKRTGTYVTIQAFQQGIGTASCGPAVAEEYQYTTDRDYELKFIVRVEKA